MIKNLRIFGINCYKALFTLFMNHKCHRKLRFLNKSIFQDLYTLQMALEQS